MNTGKMRLSNRLVTALLAGALLLAPLTPLPLHAQEGLLPEPTVAEGPALPDPETPDDLLGRTLDEEAALAPSADALAAEAQIGPDAGGDETNSEAILAAAEESGEMAALDGVEIVEEGPQEAAACLDAACVDGGMSVQYISPLQSKWMSQSSTGIPGVIEAGDQFGYALASADFNGDGMADLAVGEPLEDHNAVNAGWVTVIPGHADGAVAGVRIFTQDTRGVPEAQEAGDRFGQALATGDFNADGFADLAIGVPGESVGAIAGAGAVNVLYGGLNGLVTAGAQFFTQNTGLVPDTAEAGDGFGSLLAAGDFNNDGADDLAVSVYLEDLGGLVNAGAVSILYGIPGTGLSSAGATIFSQATAGVAGLEEAGDLFGTALVAGNFNGDAYDDVAIGVPWEDHGADPDGGVVHILHGSPSGITAAGSAFIHQDTPGVSGVVQPTEYFGYALAAGDIHGTGADELFVGIPGQDFVGAANAGMVQIITRTPTGYQSTGAWISRSPAYVPGSPTAGEWFGARLSTGDFDSDGKADLLIGVYLQAVSGHSAAGAAVLLHRIAMGGGMISQTLHLNTFGVPGAAAANDHLGLALAVGDFNGDLRPDIALGAPHKDLNSQVDAGVAVVLYNSRQFRVMTPVIMN
jgi:hypothetical protein